MSSRKKAVDAKQFGSGGRWCLCIITATPFAVAIALYFPLIRPAAEAGCSERTERCLESRPLFALHGCIEDQDGEKEKKKIVNIFELQLRV